MTSGEPLDPDLRTAAPAEREVATPGTPLLQIVTGVFAIVVAALLTYFLRTADLSEWSSGGPLVVAILRDVLLLGGVLTVAVALWSARPRRRSRGTRR